jgi:hypothetical protein
MGLSSYLREKQLHLWLGGFLRHSLKTRLLGLKVQQPRHLLFAFCDHFEPLWGKATDEVGQDRVAAWVEGYPRLTAPFRDADGHHPQHSFFFPGEQYRPQFLEDLATLARQQLGEVEFHLHHDGDTAEKLGRDLARYLGQFAEHGHLARDPDGRLRYAFIHGNWCLANSRKDGRYCGVDNELQVLFDTGCYADFTWPAAPDECQPHIVNQIYWPLGDLGARRAYDHRWEPARVGHVQRDRLLFIQGPLALARKRGRVPIRLENSHLTGIDPGSPERVRTWVQQQIHVKGRPEWIFVKVHTHGAPEQTARGLLGEGGRLLHRELTTRYNDGQRWILHYVTAREMYNIAMAAMAGSTGNPDQYRDFLLPPPPIKN